MTQDKQMSHPSDLLMDFVVSLLTPFLLIGSITDPALARRAAAETIAAYQESGQNHPINIAQIAAFALTSLDSLRLSLQEDLSLSMKLKLRGNANALNRSAQRETQPPKPQNPPQTDRDNDKSWAAAMTDVATEYTAELDALPPAERRIHQARIGALSEIATMLNAGKAPPLKSRLLGSPT
jgi:hypothetical protein